MRASDIVFAVVCSLVAALNLLAAKQLAPYVPEAATRRYFVSAAWIAVGAACTVRARLLRSSRDVGPMVNGLVALAWAAVLAAYVL